jgi:redox-sensitive bicupin YhaK (pirin superfamily)
MGTFEAGKLSNYTINTPGNGAYVFLLDGRAKINGTELNKRDAIGVYDSSSFTIETEEESRYLIIDVPMS